MSLPASWWRYTAGVLAGLLTSTLVLLALVVVSLGIGRLSGALEDAAGVGRIVILAAGIAAAILFLVVTGTATVLWASRAAAAGWRQGPALLGVLLATAGTLGGLEYFLANHEAATPNMAPKLRIAMGGAALALLTLAWVATSLSESARRDAH